MISVALLLAIGGATFGLHGRVIDEKTGRPVADAIVILVLAAGGEDIAAVSDSSGRFELAVTPGTYRVAVQREEYFSLDRTEELDARRSADFVLALRPDEECTEALAEQRAFDHLEPEPRGEGAGMSELYHQALFRVLLPAHPDPSTLAVLVVPSFSEEESVILEDRNGSPVVVATRMERHLWAQDPSTWGGSPSTRIARVPVSKATARQLRSLWKTALADARKKPEGSCLLLGADGETYHFFQGKAAGTTWSPDRGTKMAGLVDIAHQLVELAWAAPVDRPRLEAEVGMEVSSLLTRFKRSH